MIYTGACYGNWPTNKNVQVPLPMNQDQLYAPGII